MISDTVRLRMGLRTALAVAFLAAPLVALSATAASAAPSDSGSCFPTTSAVGEVSFDGPGGTAQVQLNSGPCASQDVSLVSYAVTTGAMYPQTRIDIDTVTLTSVGDVVDLTVDVPECSAQVDLIYGSDAPTTLTAPYFAPAGTLIDHANFGTDACTTEPPTTSSTPPVTTTSTSVLPSSTSTSPPVTTTSTSVLPSSTSKAPTSSTTTSSSTPPVTTTSTTVLPTSTSRAPENRVLPFTGSSAPIGLSVGLGAALLAGGGALVGIARRFRGGAHRNQR